MPPALLRKRCSVFWAAEQGVINRAMAIKFTDIMDAFEYVSFCPIYECQAFLDTETGKIYVHSDLVGGEEELPEDIDDDRYIAIPHKNELGLGKPLALDFAYEYLPDDVERVNAIFGKRGAYARFKALLEGKNLLDKWYEYEASAQERALRAWCEECGIEVEG